MSRLRVLLPVMLTLVGGLFAVPATAQADDAAVGDPLTLVESVLAEDGYLWHDNGGAGATYSGDGSSLGRYNPTGEDIVVARTGVGLYSVTISATPQTFTPTVTALSTTGNHCKVGQFTYPGTSVSIRCYDSAGVATDEEFTLRWTTTVEDATLFVAADGLFICCGTNPWGAAATVAKTAVGVYEVTVPGGPNFEGGHVQATAYGLDPSHCKVVATGALTATIGCFEPDGDPIDSSFTFLRVGSGDDAFVWANKPTDTVPYVANTFYSHNPQGTDPTSVKTATGRYTVAVPGHLVDFGGSVAITAYGDGSEKCGLVSFVADLIDVACSDSNGTAADSRFNLLFTRFQTCDGLPANIEVGNGTSAPTAGDDIIVGTDGDDNIAALDGNDTICGRAGDDTILGGGGADVVFGEGGDDLISGNAGDDNLDGGSGADTIFAGSGDDIVVGGNGPDVLGGSSGSDVIDGGGGADLISGGSDDDGLIDGGIGNDAVNGGGGNDANVTGGDGNDTVSGNGGQDTITGGDGNDQVRGGQADDTVLGGPGDDFVAGNDGIDICDGEGGADTAAGNCETILNVP